MEYYNKILNSARFISENLDLDNVSLALVLGSGLSFFTDSLKEKRSVGFDLIPGFNLSKVIGHNNRLATGYVGSKKILVMEGRIHYYEGYNMQEVTFPIRVMKELGINTLILTNSAGGIQGLSGELMVIKDHLDVFCPNPLIGSNIDKQGTRFPDMSQIYSKELIEMTINKAKQLNISAKTGVYAYLTGPSYETPFDISFLKMIGVGGVGMSTVPEAIVAKHCGIRVLGISCITNSAAGISKMPLSHEEVVATTAKVSQDFSKLLASVIEEIKL